MFTVKHRDGYGVENIYAAETVRVIRRGDRFEDGIYVNYRDIENGLTADHIITFWPSPEPCTNVCADEPRARIDRPVVWVVNAMGETVATHYLD